MAVSVIDKKRPTHLCRLNVGRGQADVGLGVGAEVGTISAADQTCKEKNQEI